MSLNGRRDKLILEYMWLVPALVKKFFYKVPIFVESPKDLCSIGNIGLVEAADRWDDSLKQSMTFKNWACRRIMGNILDELQKRNRQRGILPCEVFQDMYRNQIEYPDIEYEAKQLRKYVNDLLCNLTAKERLVIKLVYLNGLSQYEVGVLLGLTESRISRMIAKCKVIVSKRFGNKFDFMVHDDAYLVSTESINENKN